MSRRLLEIRGLKPAVEWKVNQTQLNQLSPEVFTCLTDKAT
jgi:hypothetical protein